MCSQRRELAHIKPHIYGEGCGHRLTERKREQEREKEGGGQREREVGRDQEDQPWLMNFILFLLK